MVREIKPLVAFATLRVACGDVRCAHGHGFAPLAGDADALLGEYALRAEYTFA